MTGFSMTPTPWLLHCPQHGSVYLTHDEYLRQLLLVGDRWTCPGCGRESLWDDENYEQHTNPSPTRRPRDPPTHE